MSGESGSERVARVRARDLAYRVDVRGELKELMASLSGSWEDADPGLDPTGYPGGPLAPGAPVDLGRAFHAARMRAWRQSSEVEADALVRNLMALVRAYPGLLPQEVRRRLLLPVRMPRMEATAWAVGALVGGTALALASAGALAAGGMAAVGVRSVDDLRDALGRGGMAARRNLEQGAGLPAKSGGPGGQGSGEDLRDAVRRQALRELEREAKAAEANAADEAVHPD